MGKGSIWDDFELSGILPILYKIYNRRVRMGAFGGWYAIQSGSFGSIEIPQKFAKVFDADLTSGIR